MGIKERERRGCTDHPRVSRERRRGEGGTKKRKKRDIEGYEMEERGIKEGHERRIKEGYEREEREK